MISKKIIPFLIAATICVGSLTLLPAKSAEATSLNTKASTYSSYNETLRLGSSGENVRYFQMNLNVLLKQFSISGPIDADSKYGPDTRNAVIAFQQYCKKNYNCSNMTVDGIAGSQTWNALYALMDGYGSQVCPR